MQKQHIVDQLSKQNLYTEAYFHRHVHKLPTFLCKPVIYYNMSSYSFHLQKVQFADEKDAKVHQALNEMYVSNGARYMYINVSITSVT